MIGHVVIGLKWCQSEGPHLRPAISAHFFIGPGEAGKPKINCKHTTNFFLDMLSSVSTSIYSRWGKGGGSHCSHFTKATILTRKKNLLSIVGF